MLIGSLLFTLACGVIVWLHFAFALREWRRTRGGPTLVIDMGYQRSEAHLPMSFRAKLAEWLESPARPAPDGVGHVIDRPGERIRIVESTTLPGGYRSDEVLAVLGDFSCGERCTFAREIYVQGRCTIGDGSLVQAIAVDGDLVLGRRTGVVRWADADGEVTVGTDCQVGARVTSRRSIVVRPGARARSFYAPEVRTLPEGAARRSNAAAAQPALAVPPQGEAPRGAWPYEFSRLSTACWRYGGTLSSERPLEIGQTLLVQGALFAADGSRFTAAVKASGSIRVGRGSSCLAELISDRSIVVGPESQLGGHLMAGDCAVLECGVRAGSPDARVGAYAHRVLYVRDSVVVNGKLSAGDYVQVLDAHELLALSGMDSP